MGFFFFHVCFHFGFFLVLVEDSPWLSWSSSVEVAFWFAVAQAKAGGFSLLLFVGVVFLVFLLFIRCGGDCRVLAVPRPGVHLWNLAEVLGGVFLLFQTFASLRCVFSVGACCFHLGACFFFHLQDWWVDQHGDYTWDVPPKLWRKAEGYTDWARESLSGPVGVEDLLCHFVSRLHYFVCRWSVVQCAFLVAVVCIFIFLCCCCQGFSGDGRGCNLG